MTPKPKQPKADERVEIPLRMLKGNLDVLLENRIEVGTISAAWDEDSGAGVVLMIEWANDEQEEAARALGFRTKKRVRRIRQ